MTPAEPPTGPGVLNKAAILAHISEVGDGLAARGLTGALVVVGGSYLALRDLRDATADVDSVTRLTSSLRAVVAEVAERHGMRPDWLNDNAVGFAPAGLRRADCEVLFQHAHLTVLGPPPNQVFLMKLFASRAPDHDDMVALWPHCTFSDAEAAVADYQLAYPHEELDPHLVSYVQQVADLASEG